MYIVLIKAYFYKFTTWDHYFSELLYKSILKTGYKRCNGICITFVFSSFSFTIHLF